MSNSGANTRSTARRHCCLPITRGYRAPSAPPRWKNSSLTPNRMARAADAKLPVVRRAAKPRTAAARITYRVEIADLHAHLFRVTLTIPRPAAHRASACRSGFPAAIWCASFRRICRAWQASQGSGRTRGPAVGQDPLGGRLRHVDAAGAGLRGVCLRRLGAHRLAGRDARFFQWHQPVSAGAWAASPSALALELRADKAVPDWRVATGLAPVKVDRRGFGRYLARGLRRTGRLPGRARAVLGGGFRGLWRAPPAGRRRGGARIRRRAPAGRHAAHLRDRDTVLAWQCRADAAGQQTAASGLSVSAQRRRRWIWRAGASQLDRADRGAQGPAASADAGVRAPSSPRGTPPCWA